MVFMYIFFHYYRKILIVDVDKQLTFGYNIHCVSLIIRYYNKAMQPLSHIDSHFALI